MRTPEEVREQLAATEAQALDLLSPSAPAVKEAVVRALRWVLEEPAYDESARAEGPLQAPCLECGSVEPGEHPYPCGDRDKPEEPS